MKDQKVYIWPLSIYFSYFKFENSKKIMIEIDGDGKKEIFFNFVIGL